MSAGASGRSRPAARTKAGTDRSGISTSGKGLASATDVLLGDSSVAPVSHRARPGVTGGSLRPEHRLGAAEERDGLPGRLVADGGVPHLRRPAGVRVGADDADPALARG